MNIAIIDADLVGRIKHRFPNLACMKISSFHKNRGDNVTLELSYDNLENYDKVYVSKVFTDTVVPDGLTELSWVVCGGTGFYFDKAPNLPDEIEHSFPDYHLYDDWVNQRINEGISRSEFKEYLDYSIGFLTRGCFRKCGFCVNKKYDRVFSHSPLKEFYDPSRKKICLLDDNFLGQPNWKVYLEELIATNKPFKFKQGLDERLLSPEKCELLFNSKYDGAITFAFDNIADYRIIEKKLKLIRKYTSKEVKFYVLCGFDNNSIYDANFWVRDIVSVFGRIQLLGRYGAIPYIMRFERYNDSPYKGIYITLARWCNQPGFFRTLSLNEYINLLTSRGEKAPKRYRDELLADHPILNHWFSYRYFRFGGNK